jgi:hypothetical protein
MWNLGDQFAYRVPAALTGGGAIRDVTVDPDAALPDIDRRNNRWPAPR